MSAGVIQQYIPRDKKTRNLFKVKSEKTIKTLIIDVFGIFSKNLLTVRMCLLLILNTNLTAASTSNISSKSSIETQD